MKKLIFALALALALFSCEKEDDPKPYQGNSNTTTPTPAPATLDWYTGEWYNFKRTVSYVEETIKVRRYIDSTCNCAFIWEIQKEDGSIDKHYSETWSYRESEAVPTLGLLEVRWWPTFAGVSLYTTSMSIQIGSNTKSYTWINPDRQ